MLFVNDDSNPDIRFDLYTQDINDWKCIQELCPQFSQDNRKYPARKPDFATHVPEF